MVKHKEISIDKRNLRSLTEIVPMIQSMIDEKILRWSISKVTTDFIFVEVSTINTVESEGKFEESGFFSPKQVIVSIIPTGIGCSIGGFAADAAPATNLLASVSDYLITNPNAVNASNFINVSDEIMYTEGYLLDRFMEGKTSLYPVTQNKVGVIIEHSTPDNLETVMNIINTVRAVYGVQIEAFVVTKQTIGSTIQRTQSGSYVGSVRRPDVLFEACDELIAKGCNAIAVTTNFEGITAVNYEQHFKGNHPNPVGGCEAIISHSVVRRYNIPCAHAPMINFKEIDHKVVDARAAGEMASKSGLACVLIGLAKAPSTSVINGKSKDVISIANVLALVAPASALGAAPIVSALKHDIPIIAVKDNQTILNITKETLDIKKVIEVNNYFEAVGVIQALKKGISIESVLRPLSTLRATECMDKLSLETI